MSTVPLIVLSLFLSHCYACQYFESDEFKAKVPSYKLTSAPEKCKEEVKGYANKAAALAMVDNNGGLCTNTYFITKYYCSKKCSELCPDMVDKKMARVVCDKFEILEDEGATADQVGFSCKCKYIGVPGFCEVPQTTWDVVEEEYETSCLADMSVAIVDGTSATPVAATTTVDTPGESATAANTSTSSTPPTTATSAAAQPTTAATTSDNATASNTPADAAESTTHNTTQAALATSTETQPATATTPEWETLVDHMLVWYPTLNGQKEDRQGLTLDACEQLCLGEYAEQCQSYMMVREYGEPLDECWVMSRTRFDHPEAFSLPGEQPYGTYFSTYVGRCNGPAAECGVPPTDSQFYKLDYYV